MNKTVFCNDAKPCLPSSSIQNTGKKQLNEKLDETQKISKESPPNTTKSDIPHQTLHDAFHAVTNKVCDPKNETKSTQVSYRIPKLQGKKSPPKIRSVKSPSQSNIKINSIAKAIKNVKSVHCAATATYEAKHKRCSPDSHNVQNSASGAKKKLKSSAKRSQSPKKKTSERCAKHRSPLNSQFKKHPKTAYCEKKYTVLQKENSKMNSNATSNRLNVSKLSSPKKNCTIPPIQTVKKVPSNDLCLTESIIDEPMSCDVEMTDLSDLHECKDLDIYSEEAMQIDITCIASQSCILVVDTNVLISDLNFIKQLIDISLYDCGPPFLYFPWIVIQELDGLKSNPDTKTKAIQAVQYVFSMLSRKHPRFIGQSHKAYKMSQAPSAACNDDKILMCCETLCEIRPNDKIILLSNDKNLCNKGMISDLEIMTVVSLKLGIRNMADVRNKLTSSQKGNLPNHVRHYDFNKELTGNNYDKNPVSDVHELRLSNSNVNNDDGHRSKTKCCKEDHDIVISVLNHIWQLMSHLCGLMLDSKGVVHDLEYCKSNSIMADTEIATVWTDLLPAIFLIKQRLAKVLHSTENVEKSITAFHKDLMNFVPSLPIQVSLPPVENFTIERLTSFCYDSANRQRLLIGHSQVQKVYSLLNGLHNFLKL